MSNTPSDDELQALWEESDHPLPQNFARSVLAKWGTPQSVVREPLTDEQRHALSIAFSSSKVSISEVQRRMKISYSRAQEICQWIVDSGFAQGLPTAPSLKADLGITQEGGQHDGS